VAINRSSSRWPRIRSVSFSVSIPSGSASVIAVGPPPPAGRHTIWDTSVQMIVDLKSGRSAVRPRPWPHRLTRITAGHASFMRRPRARARPCRAGRRGQGMFFRLAPGGRSGCPCGVPGGGRRPWCPSPDL
jgi:hypothetical protein